jgi:hypothetical protein
MLSSLHPGVSSVHLAMPRLTVTADMTMASI